MFGRLAAYPRCSADQGNARTLPGVEGSVKGAVLLLAMAAVAGAEPFAKASHCGTLGCAWVITVSQDGLVAVEIPGAAHRARRYRLPSRELAAFRQVVMRERAIELSGVMGDLTVDGPVRVLRVSVGNRAATIRLHTTPPGFAAVYQSDTSSLGRALRVCEAIRLLGGRELASCVDAR